MYFNLNYAIRLQACTKPRLRSPSRPVCTLQPAARVLEVRNRKTFDRQTTTSIPFRPRLPLLLSSLYATLASKLLRCFYLALG